MSTIDAFGKYMQCVTALALTAGLAACGGYSSSPSAPQAAPMPVSGPILSTLRTATTIGSTLDPSEHGGNPYGLAVAPVTSGLVTSGDLIVCNFNDGATNTQGLGTTMIGLHPVKGSMPYRIAQSSQLLGCSAVTTLPGGNIVATASQANKVVLVSPAGIISTPFNTDTFAQPWGAFSASNNGNQELFVSNASSGSIDRITLSGNTQTGFTEIAKGFSINNGAPGAISAPAGLTYDASIDTLYVVDTNANRVVSIAGVSTMGTDGVVVSGTTFTGPSAAAAKVIASGSPLNGPISGALLVNGNIVVGNTLDANGTNLLIEISPTMGMVATKNVDTGAGGAIFGIVAVPVTISVSSMGTGYNGGNTTISAISNVIYFNDDNSNTVVALSQ